MESQGGETPAWQQSLGKQRSVKFRSKALESEGPGSNPGSTTGKWPDLSILIRKPETMAIITASRGYFKSETR